MRKVIFIVITGFIALSSYYLYIHKDQRASLNLHQLIQKDQSFEKWIQFNPEGEKFSAFFPGKPEMISRDLPIPRSSDYLPYKEYKYERADGCHFLVSYALLPDEWLKYGESLILGGALKLVMNELGMSHLVGKSSLSFKSYPALDYQYYKDNTESAGTLILIKNILYKVEMVYPRDKHDKVQNELVNFIENFTPTLDQSES